MVNEWGAFLSVQLFYDAIAFFRNGKENIVKPLEIYCENVFFGTQNLNLLNKHTAFNLSALTKGKKFYRKHLEKLSIHTSLNTVQWINFNHHKIEFETIIEP